MAKTPKRKLILDKGVFSNASVHEAPLIELDNVTPIVAGQATVRRGMRPVTFSAPQGASDSHQVLGMATYRHPLGDGLLWRDSNGDLHFGRSPA